MDIVPGLLARNIRIIDLSADFRLSDPAVWERWYGRPHAAPDLLAEAVYGLPETNREMIRRARLVACPGCYPTTVQLGFLPLLEQRLVDPSQLIADAKSGVSGAGRTAALGALFCEAGENLKAYSVSGHRHLPEIIQGLHQISRSSVGLTFVPHLTPMIRGIHATLYAQLQRDTDLQALYEQRYATEPFVDVLPSGGHPETRSVRGSNMCRLAVHRPSAGSTVVVLSVTDNLVKGASGQAIQNMNLMFDLEETAGLTDIAAIP
jgi:N-acetyl-gamma-glutamyl-phosphate reductase